jgi:hypothetical protein
MDGCDNEFATYAHGTQGMAIFSQAGHMPSKARKFKGQRPKSDEMLWAFPQPNRIRISSNGMTSLRRSE